MHNNYEWSEKRKMKKILTVLLALCMLFALAACVAEAPPPVADTPAPPAQSGTEQETPPPPPVESGDDSAPAPAAPLPPAEPFPGKIAIITNTVDQNEEEYRSAEALVSQYGSSKVVHRTWPVLFAQEGEMMISIIQEIAGDPEVKALIINQAVLNTNAAIDKFREARNDVFIVCCSIAENPDDSAVRADLVLMPDELMQGETIVMQAKALGADTLAHYSFARHMSVPLLAGRRDIMKAACEREGLKFVDLTAPDPMSDVGMPGAQLYIMQDVPKQVAKLGPNTAFFSTNCGMQIPLITQVVETGAIYPQPCCPSPYHGFPTALGIASSLPTGQFNDDGEEIMSLRSLTEVVDATKKLLAGKGMSGRLSTWPVPGSMLWTNAGFGYAIKWINGEVPKEFGVIDINVLAAVSAEYIASVVGEPIPVDYKTYDVEGVQFSNFILGMVDYLTY